MDDIRVIKNCILVHSKNNWHVYRNGLYVKSFRFMPKAVLFCVIQSFKNDQKKDT